MKVNVGIATALFTACAVASTASAAGTQTMRLGLPRPAVRADHARFAHERVDAFRHREGFREEHRRFAGDWGFFGGYGDDAPYPNEVASYPPPPGPAYPPTPPSNVQPYNSGTVCPVMWTWSQREHAAIRRSLCG